MTAPASICIAYDQEPVAKGADPSQPGRPPRPPQPAAPPVASEEFGRWASDVVTRYAPYVGRVALRILGPGHDVEDVVQDVFVEALPRMHQVRDPDAMRGWLAVITRRLLSRRLQRAHLARRFGLLADDAPVVYPHPEHADAIKRIYTVLNTVAPRQRIAWVLRYMEGEKLEDVATVCGCSLAAAKRRIAAVQARIEEVFGEPRD
jgi:RNA polymerase sigma-70 factor (ECF subfamily)